jgi:putative exosortase-associated protein (TIGR04073 family)
MTFLAAVALAAVFTSGCAGPEQKLGLGMSNTFEIARLGEMRRTIEQTAIFNSPGQAYTTGVIRGLDRSIGRTAMGVFQVVTFPIPPYHPLMTRTFSSEPIFPESYKPGLVSDSIFDTDTYMGYSGGDVAPWLIGSRFKVFDN